MSLKDSKGFGVVWSFEAARCNNRMEMVIEFVACITERDWIEVKEGEENQIQGILVGN